MKGFAGIDPAQGPPLIVPLQFFLLAPLSIALAGLSLLLGLELGFAQRLSPHVMGAAHLGTLGFLGAVMLGAMYQMLPVVAGAQVPWVRLSHAVLALLVVGLGSLVLAFHGVPAPGYRLAGHALLTAFALFVVPVSWALARTSTRTPTVLGMMVAVAGLVGLVLAGWLMVGVRAGGHAALDYRALFSAHVGLGALVWVGGLICAVSWQVIPMFYLSRPISAPWQRALLAATALTWVAVVGCVAAGASAALVRLALLPAGLALWIAHPVVLIRQLRARRRRRVDPSLRFWYAGLSCAPLAFVFAVLAGQADGGRLQVLLGWTALWGWAGLIVHGMLGRIVPFLVWFHRYSHRVGREWVPTLRQLLPARTATLGLVAHIGTLVAGWLAAATARPILAAVTAGGLVITAAILAYELWSALRQLEPPASEVSAPRASR